MMEMLAVDSANLSLPLYTLEILSVMDLQASSGSVDLKLPTSSGAFKQFCFWFPTNAANNTLIGFHSMFPHQWLNC